jgi:hypothetical protein
MTPLLLLSLAAVDAPITQVTVFTDQARVVRTATTSVSGTSSLEFPPLGELVDVNSLRVEATGAEVRRVDIQRLEPEKLRTDEAKALLAELSALEQQLDQQREELAVVVAERDALSRLTPQTPAAEPLKAPARLNASGWATSATFVADHLAQLQARARESEHHLKKLDERHQVLLEKAGKLGNPQTRSGWSVTAQLGGNGPATVTLSYLVRNAQWTPTWDLQLQPETNTVSLSLAGVVSQNTQEDWQHVALQLSTAIPSSAARAPKLSTWKLGAADRFLPTPTRTSEHLAPAPPVPQEGRVRSDDDLLRAQLAKVAPAPPPAPPEPETLQSRRAAAVARAEARKADGKAEPKLPAATTPDGVGEDFIKNIAFIQPEGSGVKSFESLAAVATVISDDYGYGFSRSSYVQPQTVDVTYSIAPPPSWQPPRYGPDAPVTLADGYDLTFSALQQESVASAAGARRIALWSSKWPVTVERKLYPALTSDAFLVAEIKNPSQQVLPGGPAQLYVGADPAGVARLKLVSPGEAFTLPLGIDRALKPVRNVQLVETTTGLIAKDEVGTYTVTIELANPYQVPIAVRVFDQLPLTENKDLETKLTDSKPAATVDAKKGSLEWRATIGAGQKSNFTFTYTLKRPRGWKLSQSEVAP